MRHSVRNIVKTGVTAVLATGILVAGAGSALAVTTPVGPAVPGTPVVVPTGIPTVKPTGIPTVKPTVKPTGLPTVKPTVPPTVSPTKPPVRHGDHTSYTKFTFRNNKGKQVTEWVPTNSIGYAVPTYPTDGQSCTLGILSHLPGLEGADSDTADFTRNILWDAWQLVPGSDCLDYLINQVRHHHQKPPHKVPVDD